MRVIPNGDITGLMDEARRDLDRLVHEFEIVREDGGFKEVDDSYSVNLFRKLALDLYNCLGVAREVASDYERAAHAKAVA